MDARALDAATPKFDERERYERKNAAFRAKHATAIAACAEFNKTVNNRQVRRHYARIMAKRTA